MSRKKRRNKKSHIKINLYIAIILVFVIIALLEAFIKRSKTDKNAYKPIAVESVQTSSRNIILYEGLEIPICGANHNVPNHEIRNFQNYSLCYREAYEQAEWSAYSLSSKQLVKNTERTNDFRPDPLISTQSASLADYKGSGYDRGHLTPAADMSFSERAMSETFYMSNMSPQAPQFNRGIWMYLESQVRTWAAKFGKVYVVSGPILEKPANSYHVIGSNKVAIPEYYYKVILAPLYKDAQDLNTPEDSENIIAIGFIIPNEKCDNTFWDYAVSIDEVENRTGLDFFSLLDDDIEEFVESKVIIKDWK